MNISCTFSWWCSVGGQNYEIRKITKRREKHGRNDRQSISFVTRTKDSDCNIGQVQESETLFTDLEKAMDAASAQLLNAESTVGANVLYIGREQALVDTTVSYHK